ncbi:hypothetical protein HYH03_013514 [Edaphochlamys debaryana]|uniref:Uncharacterized protein n=1 Tax=Edaphochlamys debaryana TaxID=47281 RepID=A0A835XQS8_9CHLO|nr:hypothetical protein HYH03_013514 [Edaphochlamys debaryana]|eukprot:KAG2487935.1 hypothetical protein HYH03_013514 [Edaphochlamys debaryana]
MASLLPGTAAELPELCRVCVLSDSRAKATFSDNTVVTTNSAGSSFLITTPDGRSTRQLSEYALARHSPLLAALLEFRNMHVELPCFCKPLARALRSSFSLGYIIRDATWPSPEHALEAGLAQVQPDGKVAITSEDGVAQVVLHGHARRFAVCYPLLVGERPQEAKYEYVWQTQVFSVASHPPRWRPAVRAALLAAARLGQSVDSALASLQEASTTHTEPPHLQPPPLELHSVISSQQPGMSHSPAEDWDDIRSAQHPDSHHHLAPASPSATASANGKLADGCTCRDSAGRRSDLPRADDCARTGLADPLRSDGWWGETSLSLLPPDDVLLFEWTPHATYQFLPEVGEVEVWVHADESCLVTTRAGRFLAHYRGGTGGGPQACHALGATGPGTGAMAGAGAGLPVGAGAGAGSCGEHLYAANCVPDAVWSRDQTFRYPLGPLAAHALKLRSHNTTVAAAVAARIPAQAPLALPGFRGGGALAAAGGGRGGRPLLARPSDELFAAASTAVLERSEVPGLGAFTAYADGRVRACFEDRAILHMAASHSHCKVVLPDGSVAVVATANPVGVEPYAAAATDFARWAFKTPAERAAELRAQARVRAELLNSQRMAALCEFQASRTLPPAAVAAAAAAASAAAAAAAAEGALELPPPQVQQQQQQPAAGLQQPQVPGLPQQALLPPPRLMLEAASAGGSRAGDSRAGDDIRSWGSAAGSAAQESLPAQRADEPAPGRHAPHRGGPDPPHGTHAVPEVQYGGYGIPELVSYEQSYGSSTAPVELPYDGAHVTGPDRQAMIDRLLGQNARLLERL